VLLFVGGPCGFGAAAPASAAAAFTGPGMTLVPALAVPATVPLRTVRLPQHSASELVASPCGAVRLELGWMRNFNQPGAGVGVFLEGTSLTSKKGTLMQ
jgi:hypothetical protein